VDPAERRRDLGSFIREQRNTARLSLRRLSELAGISNPYLSQIERGLRRPSADILQQIAKALRISAETLYVRAGILEKSDGAVGDLVAHIRADPLLDEGQKQALVQIYLSFVGDREPAPRQEPSTELTPNPATEPATEPAGQPAAEPTGAPRPRPGGPNGDGR